MFSNVLRIHEQHHNTLILVLVFHFPLCTINNLDTILYLCNNVVRVLWSCAVSFAPWYFILYIHKSFAQRGYIHYFLCYKNINNTMLLLWFLIMDKTLIRINKKDNLWCIFTDLKQYIKCTLSRTFSDYTKVFLSWKRTIVNHHIKGANDYNTSLLSTILEFQ